MFIKVFLVGLVAAVSPGPDFAVVMRNSLYYGRVTGFATAIGIGSALTIHILYTLLGFALIIKKNPTLFKAIQILGALYLLWLAYGILKAKNKYDSTHGEKSQTIDVEDKTFTKGYRDGFLCNSLNPKATLFFLCIFSQFLTSNTPVWVQILYGAEIIIAVTLWFIMLSGIISLHNLRSLYFKYDFWINKILACYLCYFGLTMIIK